MICKIIPITAIIKIVLLVEKSSRADFDIIFYLLNLLNQEFCTFLDYPKSPLES